MEPIGTPQISTHDAHAAAARAQEDKRAARRDRNRAAAASSRERHKKQFQAMQARVAQLEVENARLQHSIHMMQPESFAALISGIGLLRTMLRTIEEREHQPISAELSGLSAPLFSLLSLPYNSDPTPETTPETRGHPSPGVDGHDGYGAIDPSLLDGPLSEHNHPQVKIAAQPVIRVSGQKLVQRRRVPPGMVRTASNSCSSYLRPTSEPDQAERELEGSRDGDLIASMLNTYTEPTRFEVDAAENQPSILEHAYLDTLEPNLQLQSESSYRLHLSAQATTDSPSIEPPTADSTLLQSPTWETAPPSMTEGVITAVDAAQNQPDGMTSTLTKSSSSGSGTQLPGPMYHQFLDGYPEFNAAITSNSDKVIVRSKGCSACAGRHPCVELQSIRRARACLTCASKHVTCHLTAGEAMFHPDTDAFIATHNYPLIPGSDEEMAVSSPENSFRDSAPSNIRVFSLDPNSSAPAPSGVSPFRPSVYDSPQILAPLDATQITSHPNLPTTFESQMSQIDNYNPIAWTAPGRKRLVMDCVLVPKPYDAFPAQNGSAISSARPEGANRSTAGREGMSRCKRLSTRPCIGKRCVS
ncbi:hypothetical protein B0H13DRAFT_2678232 [Mycena leptocephala]|nr:hypothetical protein B0H13DRAFT_2678232 [Mycena leptocephala]